MRSRVPRLSIAVLMTAAVLAVPAGATAKPPRDGTPTAGAIRSWAAATRDLIASGAAQSLSMALIDDGRMIWSDTFGTVDAAGTPPTTDTRYGIGSVSKTFAAVTILRLVDQSLVDLDAPVTRYLPDLHLAGPDAQTITVRMLLGHTAGLPGSDYANAESFEPYADYTEQLFETLTTARLKAAPGSMAVYCNDCYTLLESVVASVTGEAYRDVVAREILAPLGMTQSGYPWVPFPAGTWAPVLDEDGTPTPMDRVNLDASGGLFSTPSDMARFAAMLAGGGELDGVRILSPEAVAAMATDQTAGTFRVVDPDRDAWRYGLGFDSVAVPGLAAAGIDGWVKGGDLSAYHAAMMIVPDEGLAAVVQGAGMGFSSSTAEALAERILLRTLADQGRIPAVPPTIDRVTSPRVTPAEAQRAAITGVYPASGGAFRVAVGDDGRARLAMLASGQWLDSPDTFSLRRDGWWWADSGQMRALGSADGWGRHYLLVRSPGGAGHALVDQAIGQRTAPADALSAAWQDRMGRAWVPVREVASSTAWAAPTVRLVEQPELAGYVQVLMAGNDQFVQPATDDLAASFLVIPQVMGRDLVDVAILQQDGQDWLRVGGMLMRPADGIPALAATDRVTIESDQTVAWRHSVAAATVITQGAAAWKVFDADLAPADAGEGDAAGVVVPAGGYLAVFAAPGTAVTVTAR